MQHALNKRPWAAAGVFVICQGSERVSVADLEDAVFPAYQVLIRKLAQGLVRVNQRQTECVGEVLLGKRKRHGPLFCFSGFNCAVVQQQQDKGDALDGGPAAQRDEVFVEKLFLSRGEPGDVIGQRREFFVERPEFLALEYTEQHVGQRADRMAHFL